MTKLIYKYSQLNDNERLPYNEAIKILKDKPKFHLGQLKLFFTELLFLTKYATDGDTVLYIGAAPGYHTSKLAELFPKLTFDLWDPRKFEVEQKSNIKVYNHFFTNESAINYSQQKLNILLMCDIRTLEIGKYKKQIEKMDEIVEDDMTMQARWANIIKPKQAYLKFRLPYGIKNFKYLTGTIYLQPYAPISTEARLLTNNYTDLIEYDTEKFDEKMAYFNVHVRYNKVTYKKWANIMEKYNLLNCWDNALGLHIMYYYLRDIKHNTSEESLGELFMDIIKYHVKKYGKKYLVLFNKNVNLEDLE